MATEIGTREALLTPEEIVELRDRLREAEETLQAIRLGEVDALIVEGDNGSQVFTLRGAELPYRLIVEEMSQGAATLLPDGTLLYGNQRLADMLYTPLQKLIGSSVYEYVGENDRVALEQLVEATLSTKRDGSEELEQQGGTASHNLEVILRVSPAGTEHGAGKQHERIPAYLSASTLQIEEVDAVCLVITDLTERKRQEEITEEARRRVAEEQLKANKLEAIGILAGGIAHDINNALTAMLANIVMAARAVEKNDVVARRLAEAEVACLKARDVTQQLLTFARGGQPVKNVVAIAALLREWSSFALAGSNAACEFVLAEDLRPVEIDEGQIGRVVSNLLINAQQSMPHGGLITVRAENSNLDQKQIAAEGLSLAPGHYVRIYIQDRGIGIAERDLPKIFDPYFTTKQSGSGLGLASAYSIIKNHSGNISVESQLGVGTTFRLTLPASGAELSNYESTGLSVPNMPRKVLIMDDSEAIRDIVGVMLIELDGAEVDYAEHGDKALELYCEALESGRPFDVVLMDLTIGGGTGGKEAVLQLLKVDPQAKVIVFSGYSSDPIVSNYKEYGFSGVLRKPFAVDELLEEVHRVTGDASKR